MEMLRISQDDFMRLVKFVQANYGIDLSKKKNLIEARLQFQFANSGHESFASFLDATIRNPAEVEILLNRLTTNHTYFMRESTHFDFLRETVLPELEQKKRDRVISIWSAGCSSGEEPYTLSMILKDYFKGKGNWDTRVLATDISQQALAKAKAGRYTLDSVESLPERWQKQYFLKDQNGAVVSPELKNNVIFKTFNLMDPIHFRLKFDVIFCRNVMIYFDGPTKDDLVRRFHGATAPGGHLFVGLSENLSKEENPYQMIRIGVYKKT